MSSISDSEQLLLDEFINDFDSNDNNYEKNFELINLIIQLKKDNEHFSDDLYKHIKDWMSFYIEITQNKKYGYDKIIPNKVIEMVNCLKTEEQISILNYFIRLLKKNLLNDEIDYYENHKNILEMKLEYENHKYHKWLMKKSILNLTNLLTTLVYILLLLTGLLHFLLTRFEFIKITTVNYNSNPCLNIFVNIIDYIFELSGDVKPQDIASVSFFLFVKFIFFIFIAYFIVNKITKKLDRL